MTTKDMFKGLDMKTRICIKCSKKKKLNLKNFYWRKSRGGRKASFRKECKKCTCKKRVEYHHKYYEIKLKDKMAIRVSKWQKDNRIKINIKNVKREKKDLNFKLKNRLRNRIHSAIRYNTNYENQKDQTTLTLLGVSNIEFVWKQLESKFKPGMTRENCGKWHIDHIVPCSSFDLKCPVQQLTCFHYSNLQPLWAKENLSKGAKYE
jgi:hypothetical protein